MKTLILIRHAKSDWNDLSAPDYERALNHRGLHDAPMMGRRLAEQTLVPDLFTASSAVRARMTAELMAEAMGYPEAQLLWRDELYLAEAPTMLDIIRKTPETVGSLALLAHNPGMTGLVERLTGERFDHMPTAGVVALKADIAHWREAGRRWQLHCFDYPKHLQ